MDQWVLLAKRADFDAWGKALGVSNVLARILRNRDIETLEQAACFLNEDLAALPSPWDLPDMAKAVDQVRHASMQLQLIRIIGDYDVDGICASSILAIGLQALGARFDVMIPHRIEDGYGINTKMIEQAAMDGVSLLITCDNGIAAKDAVDLANQLGLRVVVTDHHEVPFLETDDGKIEMLPNASAVVDPKREGSTYRYPNICGAVVAAKLIEALTSSPSEQDAWACIRDDILQLCALATVCDVMELQGENRVIVREGLKRLKEKPIEGVQALMTVNGIGMLNVSTYHLGFILGPCLNAAGRLESAQAAVELIRCQDKEQAMKRALILKELNESRKALTMQGVEEAFLHVERFYAKDRVLVIYLPGIHESLAGIIAGRVREKYKKPTFVLTDSTEGIKGSGRSIPNYHMFQELNRVRDFFLKFGGHPLAAGFTLKSNISNQRLLDGERTSFGESTLAKLEESDTLRLVACFRTKLNQLCELREQDFISKIMIDMLMPLSYPTMEFAKELERLEPHGMGNPKPLFAQKQVRFLRGTYMGVKKNAARFDVRTSQNTNHQLVYFGDLGEFQTMLDECFGEGSGKRLFEQPCAYLLDITYHVAINTYRGVESVQFLLKHYQPSP
ncbi:MAG: single-stranded-DNA-specific exonuclease RecJ [Clostridium sp.]|jgi:single-stranded-DNA-specific exonuclease|nr:single-stranded-DNA-specific exonuclease RecJ [Clostridium sp.]